MELKSEFGRKNEDSDGDLNWSDEDEEEEEQEEIQDDPQLQPELQDLFAQKERIEGFIKSIDEPPVDETIPKNSLTVPQLNLLWYQLCRKPNLKFREIQWASSSCVSAIHQL